MVAFPAGGLAQGRHLRQRAEGGRTAGGLRSGRDLDEGGAGRACLPYGGCKLLLPPVERRAAGASGIRGAKNPRSEEHTSELQSLMRNSYAVFLLEKKTTIHKSRKHINSN